MLLLFDVTDRLGGAFDTETNKKTHLWDVTIIYINVRSALPCLIGLHDLRAKVMYVAINANTEFPSRDLNFSVTVAFLSLEINSISFDTIRKGGNTQ